MSQNHIALDLTYDQITTARAGLDQLATALTGLVAIPDSDRRNLIYLGPRSEVFVQQTLRVMAANPQIVPPSLDLAGRRRTSPRSTACAGISARASSVAAARPWSRHRCRR